MTSSRYDKPRLGELLVDTGLITVLQLQQALSRQEEIGGKLGEALVQLGFVTESAIMNFLVRQRPKSRIGEKLVEAEIITAEQLQTALRDQQRTGKKLGQSLAQLGILNEVTFLEFFSRQLQLPFVDLRTFNFVPELVQLLPETMARRFRSVVLAKRAKGLLVGMADPTDIFVFDELAQTLKQPILLAQVSESQLMRALDQIYRGEERIQEQVTALEVEVGRSEPEAEVIESYEMSVDAPVVKI
ncbi:MAG: MSHA biogenesis protein MshE, partial [Magnetococcales bacterium]|nr:MSHA biogenesis protein MshE [Magnetococcales bacterium]